MGNKITRYFMKFRSNNCAVSNFFLVSETQGNSNGPDLDLLKSNQRTRPFYGSDTLTTSKYSSTLDSAHSANGEKRLQLFVVLHRQTILYNFDKANSTPSLTFEFNAKKPVTMTLYFFIKENLSEKLSQSSNSSLYKFPPVSSFHGTSGNQKYTHKLPEQFPLVLKQLETDNTLDGLFPVVLQFVTEKDDRIYYTHCKWNATLNNLQCVKQSLHFHNKIIIINTLYGVQESSTSSQNISSNASLNAMDCVICLSSRSTHVVIPCNHLCLCDSCIKRFIKQEERCPMCRNYYTNILKLLNPSTQIESKAETK